MGLISCSPDSATSNLTELNLLKDGNIPITIMAPDSAVVQTMDLIVQKDVSIKGPDNYYVQIFASEAQSNKIESLIADVKKEVQTLPYFTKIISEEVDGFIFENQIDSSKFSYDFRHVQVKGDTEYRFQTGLIGTFSLEEVKLMYEAVRKK